MAPSLQNLVFATQAVLTHSPSAQACVPSQVSAADSDVPSALQSMTVEPSQRRAPALQASPLLLEVFFDEPLQAEIQRASPSTTAAPILLPMTTPLRMHQ
jgi:hypothetical protein